MGKFKKGDRVVIIKLDESDLRINPFISAGLLGTVLENSSVPFVMVDNIGKIALGENQLELVTDSKQPNTVTLILGNTAYEITGENITIKTKQL